MSEKVTGKGIRVGKDQSVMDAMEKAIPHWIHEKVEDPSYVGGFRYARNCTCSVCGYEASFEKEKCPHCGTVMQHIKGI